MDDDDPVARWRSWLGKEEPAEARRNNLWSQFYAMYHRRATWDGYLEMLHSSPVKAQQTARWLTQVLLRNHMEAQVVNILRFCESRDPRVMSFGRMLLEISESRSSLSAYADEARADLGGLTTGIENLKTFRDKFVAHLDQDREAALDPELRLLPELDGALDHVGELWEKRPGVVAEVARLAGVTRRRVWSLEDPAKEAAVVSAVTLVMLAS